MNHEGLKCRRVGSYFDIAMLHNKRAIRDTSRLPSLTAGDFVLPAYQGGNFSFPTPRTLWTS